MTYRIPGTKCCDITYEFLSDLEIQYTRMVFSFFFLPSSLKPSITYSSPVPITTTKLPKYHMDKGLCSSICVSYRR